MQFFSWIATHWQTVSGWTAGLYVLYLVSRVLTAVIKFFVSSAMRVRSAETSLKTCEELAVSVTNNHIPHLQTELVKINATLSGLHEDFRLVLREKLEPTIRL